MKTALNIETHLPDRRFRWILMGFAWIAFLLLFGFFGFLLNLGWPALHTLGFGIFKTEWNPPLKVFGISAFIYGTIMSSLLALVIATPVSVACAVLLSDLAPPKIGAVFGFLVEMLAAIPSVVYGLWGIFTLVPYLRETWMPWMRDHFGFIPLFQGPIYGVSLFSAGLILAIMIIPTITAICREVFKSIPQIQRDGVLALGATKFEMLWIAVIKSSGSGILGAMVLGLGRALGETMAVTMVIGNRAEVDASLFAPSQTMASAIASEVAEAHDLHLSALAVVGLALLILSAGLFLIMRRIMKQRKYYS